MMSDSQIKATHLKMRTNCTNSMFEDTIQCYFYFTNGPCDNELEKICNSINEQISLLSEEYIWHREGLKVSLPIFSNAIKEWPCYLTSTTCFGDNVEDEWFIVYLILEISKQYSDVIIQMEDNDGDFLLIEAANFLPSWANPETTENRVFIKDNQVHIIPPTISPLNSKITLNEALTIVQGSSEDTLAPSDVQNAIHQRTHGYPQKIKDLCHTALVKLPLELATVLKLNPNLISQLVNTYCHSDSVDVKHGKNVKFENCVTIEVKFTKCLYAMLIHSKDVKCIPLKNIPETDKMSRLGLKLLYAYEIIMNASKDVYSSAGYKKFMNSLIKNGYFKENLKGSKDYKQLLNKANDYFMNMECPLNSFTCNLISELINSSEFENSKESILQNQDKPLPEGENEEWLNINPDELNDFLSTRYGKKAGIKTDVNTPEAITKQLSKFLGQQSDFEGIERREIDQVDDDDDEKIEFNPDEFATCVEKMLKLMSNDMDIAEQNDFSDDDLSDMETMDDYEENSSITKNIDKELNMKLHNPPLNPQSNANNVQTILHNFVQGLKEEGVTGPSSNILRTIGIEKSDLLDSDDDII